MTTRIGILVFVLLASVAGAQESERSRRNPLEALGMACDGAWKEVDRTVAALAHLDREGSTSAGRERISCLLGAINETRFDERDSQYDQLQTDQVMRILVSVYGQTNYDFFAAQTKVQPDRVRHGLLAALMERGHPEAFAEYFASKRRTLARGEALPASPGAAGVFSPLIERGTCGAALCSERLEETLRVIDANLDILTTELKVTTRVQPLSADDADARRVERVRADARALLGEVERIRRGEATIGRIR